MAGPFPCYSGLRKRTDAVRFDSGDSRMPPTDPPKTWLITGASRGMGVHFAQAALAAGHQVIATARTPERVTEAIGAHERLLAARLDVTDPAGVDQAVATGVKRFGSIDVLVNNAGNF